MTRGVGPIRRSAAAAAGIALALAGNSATALAGPPQGFAIRTVVGGLVDPTAFAYAPDGRIFITEKAGVVKVVSGGHLREFADLRDRINNVDDRGLLAVALDPDFAANGWIYLAYTKELRPDDPDRLKPLHPAGGTVIRLRSSSDPGLADLSSIQTVLDGLPTPGPWHSVGDLAFDAEGRLVVGMGDGSPYFPKDIGPTPRGRSALVALDIDSASGKLLRIDPRTGRGVPGNPYYDAAHPNHVRSKVIAEGLRNPFRFSIDPRNGDVWIGDPGSSDWEELDLLPHGANAVERNFGWPCYEGARTGLAEQTAMVTVPACKLRFYSHPEPKAAAPAFAYHFNGSAIIAGPVLEGRTYPHHYRGRVFFADYVRGIVFTYAHGKAERFGTPGGWGTPVDLELTPAGNLAYADLATGRLREVVNLRPVASPRSRWWWVAIAAAVLLAVAGAVSFRRLVRRASPA